MKNRASILIVFTLACCAPLPTEPVQSDGGIEALPAPIEALPAPPAPVPIEPLEGPRPEEHVELSALTSEPACSGSCAREERCVAGTCVPRCSHDEDQHGACRDGEICVYGECDASLCRSIAKSEECVLCMEEHRCDALLACWDEALGGYRDCWYCFMDTDAAEANVCACRTTEPACAACDHLPFLACVEQHCPSC